MFSDPSSTYYNRPDIEYQQFSSNNAKLCEIGANLDLPSETIQYPTARSTGNGIVFLTGQLTVNAPIAQFDQLLTLPNEYLPAFEMWFPLIINSVASGTLARGLSIAPTGEVIYQSNNNIPAADTIYFNTVIYLKQFSP